MNSSVGVKPMYDSLHTDKIQAILFTEQDGFTVTVDDYAALRRSFFESGEKTCRLNRGGIMKGMAGKVKGKMTAHNFFWKKTVGNVDIEEAFSTRTGYVLVKRNFDSVITAKIHFNKDHTWIKSEYFEMGYQSPHQSATVLLKPAENFYGISRFDYQPERKKYMVTTLHAAPYPEQPPQQSLLNARFGNPAVISHSSKGSFCYCPDMAQALQRQQALQELEQGTVVMMPAWEVRDGEVQTQAPAEEALMQFTAMDKAAHLPENPPKQPDMPIEAPKAASASTTAAAPEVNGKTVYNPGATAILKAATEMIQDNANTLPEAVDIDAFKTEKTAVMDSQITTKAAPAETTLSYDSSISAAATEKESPANVTDTSQGSEADDKSAANSAAEVIAILAAAKQLEERNKQEKSPAKPVAVETQNAPTVPITAEAPSVPAMPITAETPSVPATPIAAEAPSAPTPRFTAQPQVPKTHETDEFFSTIQRVLEKDWDISLPEDLSKRVKPQPQDDFKKSTAVPMQLEDVHTQLHTKPVQPQVDTTKLQDNLLQPKAKPQQLQGNPTPTQAKPMQPQKNSIQPQDTPAQTRGTLQKPQNNQIRVAQPDGKTVYEGGFADGKRDGFGTYYYKDGTLCYTGFWKEDKKEGLGVSFRHSDHAMHVSSWKKNAPTGFTSLFDKQGNFKFGGKIVKGKKTGVGISYNNQDGSVFVGKWENGKPTGYGSAFDENGNLLYSGMWENGKRSGTGTAFDKNGDVLFSGEWKDDHEYNGILYKKPQQEAVYQNAPPQNNPGQPYIPQPTPEANTAQQPPAGLD